MSAIKTFALQYNKYFQNLVVLTDFNAASITSQIEMRFRNVLHYVNAEIVQRQTLPANLDLPVMPKGMVIEAPAVITIGDISPGFMDYAAYTLYNSARTLGRSAPNLYIYVTSTASPNGEGKVMLVTDWGNTYIGLNNGTLGLIKAYYSARNIGCELYSIDEDMVETLEQIRMDEPTYSIPASFHGRDIFAVTAGLIAGGIPAHQLGQKIETEKVADTPFTSALQSLPLKLKSKVEGVVFSENGAGQSVISNFTTDTITFDQLVDEKAVFKISCQSAVTGKKQVYKCPVVRTAAQAGGTLSLSGMLAPLWDEYFVTILLPSAIGKGKREDTHAPFTQRIFIERLR